MKRYRLSISCLLLVLGIMSGACGTLQVGVEGTPADSSPLVAPTLTLEASPTAEVELYSSDQLGICFSYPQGYTQVPYNDSVEIVAPAPVPDSEDRGLFWLDVSDSQGRTAEEVADRELRDVAGLNPGRWTVSLGGEQALVLDGMPGQNLVRRVYIVRQETLYILTFSPTRSENSVASEQMETLYAAVTSSWAWSPCSVSE
jgi:hypothetical protein